MTGIKEEEGNVRTVCISARYTKYLLVELQNISSFPERLISGEAGLIHTVSVVHLM